MKRRVTLLICTIISICVSLALITYTIIKQAQQNTVDPNRDPIIDVNIPGGDVPSDIAVVVEKNIYVYVGEEIADAFLVENKDQVISKTDVIAFDETNNTFVAQKAGVASLTIITNGEKAYKYNIYVFEKGQGTDENPFNIIRVEQLIDLVEDYNDSSVYYVQQCDLDLSAYESWKPIGDMKQAFLANYDGNGYAIVNMKIIITNDNINDYLIARQSSSGVNMTTTTLGFFGRVGDSNNYVTIKGLSVRDAVIDTTAVDGLDTLDVCYIGVLAGQTRYSTVNGLKPDGTRSIISATINSAWTINDITYSDGVIAGLVGCTEKSTVSGYDVKVAMESSSFGFVKNSVYYGSCYAGLIGTMYNSTLNNCDVEMSWTGKNYVGTYVAGAVDFIFDNYDRSVNNATISNVNVNNMDVTMYRYTNSTTLAARVSGAVDTININKTFINNVHVNNIKIAGIGTAQAAGFVSINEGTINDCTVDGLIKASISAGFAYKNNGVIKYTTTSPDPAVDAKIYGQTKVAGFAIYNYGEIKSYTNAYKEIITSLYWSKVYAEFLNSGETIQNKYMIAGIAVVSAGANSKIENFRTITNIYDAVNAAGAVGYFGYYSYVENGRTYVENGGTIQNCSINSTIRTISGIIGQTSNSGKAEIVSGLVAVVPYSSTSSSRVIKDVNVAITINNITTTAADKVYGFKYFGGLIALAEAPITVTSTSGKTNSVIVKVYCSYSAGTVYAGGAIGYVNTAKVSTNKVAINYTKISGNIYMKTGINYKFNSIYAGSGTISKSNTTSTVSCSKI